ncbi:TetR/AcrR family transcriptional regulator [Ectopseudomonas mendocina]|uniref:TetR/AcrR family transcriptional regulator n=1 Tax=Ectopseudomonas mendocina TaxID=300 RepID=A0ABZ2RJB3_ECTME
MPDNFSPASGPGRPKDLAKRKAILDAAKNLFLIKGYDGSSMDAIAAEAGVSKLTVYSHFSDKETLFAAAIKAQCTAQLPEKLFELDDSAPLEQVLLEIGHSFYALINSRESLALHRVMMSMAAQNSKLPKLFYDAGPQRLQVGMEDLLRRADQSGKLSVPNPRTAADQFFCLVKGGCNFRLLIGLDHDAPSEEDARQNVEDAVGVFLRAFRP